MQSVAIIPQSLVKWTNKPDMALLLNARWHEHLIEEQLLHTNNTICSDGFQHLLMRHRLERAKVEVELYSTAVGREVANRAETQGSGDSSECE